MKYKIALQHKLLRLPCFVNMIILSTEVHFIAFNALPLHDFDPN